MQSKRTPVCRHSGQSLTASAALAYLDSFAMMAKTLAGEYSTRAASHPPSSLSPTF